jgi:hypothetical protein
MGKVAISDAGLAVVHVLKLLNIACGMIISDLSENPYTNPSETMPENVFIYSPAAKE